MKYRRIDIQKKNTGEKVVKVCMCEKGFDRGTG